MVKRPISSLYNKNTLSIFILHIMCNTTATKHLNYIYEPHHALQNQLVTEQVLYVTMVTETEQPDLC